MLCVVIRQAMPWRRKDGSHITFGQNSAVIITGKGELKGSQINGAVPREVADMFPKISSHAAAII